MEMTSSEKGSEPLLWNYGVPLVLVIFTIVRRSQGAYPFEEFFMRLLHSWPM